MKANDKKVQADAFNLLFGFSNSLF